MPRVIYVSAAQSTTASDVPSIENDGVDSAVITLTLRDSRGELVQGLAASNIVLAVSGTGNTVTQPTGATDRNGQISGSFVSTVAATKVCSWTVKGLAITATTSVSVQAVGGTVATFTDISRDASSTAGGDTVSLTVSTIVDVPAVRFDGILATDITVANATTITCTVPPNTSGVCDVVCGGVSLTNPRAAKIGGAFEYLPAPTTTFVNRNFNDGVLGTGLEASVGGNVEVTTAEKYAGTHSVRTYRNTTGTSAIRNSTLINISAEANGVYARYYQLIPMATVSTLGDQIKTSLFRTTVGSGQPGWIMAGIGPDFNDGASDDTLVSFLDNGVVDIGTNNVFGRSGVGVGVWREWIFWQYWDSGASEGRMKTWIDGKLQYDVQSSVAGGTGSYRLSMGIAYIQNPTGTADVYIDEVFIANGFPTFVEPA